MTTYTLSFCIFDDLYPSYGPVHITINAFDYNNIFEAVNNLVNTCKSVKGDPTGYYIKHGFDPADITKDLLENKYYVWNRYEKYYVIAFSIDYTRFEIFSKDCDKKLIKWRENDENDEIVGIITDEDYNVSPIYKLFEKLNLEKKI